VALVAAMGVQGGGAVKPLRVLALTRYGALGASSRMRTLQYLPALHVAGVYVKVQALFDDSALLARYKRGQYGLLTLMYCFSQRLGSLLRRTKFDLLLIEKEALPWWPLWVEAAMLNGVPYVLDYDDAVFHNYDLHRFDFVRRIYGKRLDGLMARSALVVCCNDYLAQRARTAGARLVRVLPTVIDLERYPADKVHLQRIENRMPRIVWIGSPSTVRYLALLQQALQALAQRVPFVLRVIGGEFALAGVQVECVPWSEATEVSSIADCDVGIMPLFDSPWEHGKCGYKLIQYMACGLPVVASPVGVNTSIVQDDVNGFLAESSSAWLTTLERLLTQPDLSMEMGQAGRQRVEQQYCLQVTGPRLAEWLRLAGH